MVNDSPFRVAPCDGHRKRGTGQILLHGITHSPTNDAARIEIDEHGQVEPSSAGGNVSDVSGPDLVFATLANDHVIRLGAIECG